MSQKSLSLDYRVFRQIRFNRGEIIFSQGDPGDNCYIVKEGLIKITRVDGDGKEHVLGAVNAGCIFGEMALIDDQPRMGTAEVMQDSICLIITRDQFKEKLDSCDPFVRALLRILVACARLPSIR